MNRNPVRAATVLTLLLTALAGAGAPSAAAETRGASGRGAPAARPANVQTARSSVGNRNVNVSHTTSTSHNVNVSRNVNVQRSSDVHVNREVVHGRYDRWGHPIGPAIGVAATAVTLGSIAAALPPGCTAVTIAGITYEQCGASYYQPVYQDGEVQYVVVSPPQ